MSFAQFQTLGIAQSWSARNVLTEREVTKAYRALSLRYHPDKAPNDPQAAAKFCALKDAYEAVKNQIPHYPRHVQSDKDRHAAAVAARARAEENARRAERIRVEQEERRRTRELAEAQRREQERVNYERRQRQKRERAEAERRERERVERDQRRAKRELESAEREREEMIRAKAASEHRQRENQRLANARLEKEQERRVKQQEDEQIRRWQRSAQESKDRLEKQRVKQLQESTRDFQLPPEFSGANRARSNPLSTADFGKLFSVKTPSGDSTGRSGWVFTAGWKKPNSSNNSSDTTAGTSWMAGNYANGYANGANNWTSEGNIFRKDGPSSNTAQNTGGGFYDWTAPARNQWKTPVWGQPAQATGTNHFTGGRGSKKGTQSNKFHFGPLQAQKTRTNPLFSTTSKKENVASKQVAAFSSSKENAQPKWFSHEPNSRQTQSQFAAKTNTQSTSFDFRHSHTTQQEQSTWTFTSWTKSQPNPLKFENTSQHDYPKRAAAASPQKSYLHGSPREDGAQKRHKVDCSGDVEMEDVF